MTSERRLLFAAAGARLFAPAGIVLVSLFVLQPWMTPGWQWDRQPDALNHLERIYLVAAALGRGDWYPRWIPELNLGYGYPLLNFYAPATYYVAAALRGVGMTVYASYQWTGALAVAAGAAGSYALAAALHPGRRDAALLASAAFAWAPYPFFHTLYSRGALPEALATGFLPWLFLAGWWTWRRGGVAVAALALAAAVLVVTHNATALLATGFLALSACAARPEAWRHRRQVPLRVLLGLLAGAGLSAFFWLPALVEARDVQLELAQQGGFDFHAGLLDPAARLAEALGRAAGTSPARTAADVFYALGGSFKPGSIAGAQALLWLPGLLPAVPALSARAGPAGRVAVQWAALAAACWFFSTVWSTPLWTALPLLRLVQFPDRFFGLLALCVAQAGAAALAALPRHGAAGWGGRAAAALLLLLLASGSLARRPYVVGTPPAHDVDRQTVLEQEENWYGRGTTSFGEFLPRTAAWPPYPHSGRLDGPRIYDRAFPEAGWQAGLARVLGGQAALTQLWRGPTWISLQVEGSTPSRLGIHQLWFPGWRAFVDGEAAPLEPARAAVLGPDGEADVIEASLGFIALDVPAGKHRVDLRFGPTAARTLGVALSALSAIGILLFLAALAGRRPSRRAALAALALPLLATGAAATLQSGPPRGAASGNARVALDLAQATLQQAVETRAPAGGGRGMVPPYVDVQYAGVGGEPRRWLYMHPPSEVGVRLRVPAHAYLQTALALQPQAWFTETGDGVRFLVEVEAPAGHRVLLDRHVNPRARAEDRRWLDEWVSLADYAGQEVRLILRTDPVQDVTFDWGGWAHPQVVIWESARPDPAAPHNW